MGDLRSTPLVREFTHFELADELSRLSDQLRIFGRYAEKSTQDAAWMQIGARIDRIGTLGVKIEVLPVFRAPYKEKKV